MTAAEHWFYKKEAKPLSLSELGNRLGWSHFSNLEGSPASSEDLEVKIADVSSLDRAKAGDVSFYSQASYRHLLENTAASACLIKEADLPGAASVVRKKDILFVVVEDPYTEFVRVIDVFYNHQVPYTYTNCSYEEEDGFLKSDEVGEGGAKIHRTAFVHPRARLGSNVVVEAFAYVGAESTLGDNTLISPHAVVGFGCSLGCEVFVGPHASLACCVVGDRVIIHAGARIGQDGFGYGKSGKIPHVGRVLIESDVEIGANTTVDKAVVAETRIGSGSKIDNLVQLGHNVSMGSHCFIAAQTGISGSTSLGNNVYLGGQVGIKDHLSIGTNVKIGAGSGLMNDVPDNQVWVGYPAENRRDYVRHMFRLRRLAERSEERQA